MKRSFSGANEGKVGLNDPKDSVSLPSERPANIRLDLRVCIVKGTLKHDASGETQRRVGAADYMPEAERTLNI